MKPLQGIKIVDFTQAHAGSLCTMLLADFGAEVIKIERAGIGDLARYWEPIKGGHSGYFSFLNRGKKSISINASSEKGKEIILKLIGQADVVAENFKFGSMERLGLSYETLKQIKPDIIFASLNGFGQTGPLKNSIGLDLQLQAMSGIMDRTGFPDGPPTKVGAAIGDHVSGTYMAIGIMLSLIHKRKTKEGNRVDIAILDSLASILEAAPMSKSLTGEVPSRQGNNYFGISPYDVFKANDGYVAIGISTDNQWQKFCLALGMDDLAKDEKYKTNQSRGEFYLNGLRDAIEKVTLTMSKFDIEKKLRDARLACGAVCTVKETMHSEYIKQRKFFATVQDKALGTITIPGTTIHMSDVSRDVLESAPLLGEHTKMYLQQLGYSEDQVAALHNDKIIEIV